MTRFVWAFVGRGKRGHAFRLAANGEVANPLYAVCGVGPGIFSPAHLLLGIEAMPHCKRCEKLVPVAAAGVGT
jgi:hypothetical protein